jgi:hypothetical protein
MAVHILVNGIYFQWNIVQTIHDFQEKKLQHLL